MHSETTRNGLTVSTDPARLDVDAVFEFISANSYWALGIPRATLERALAHSLCFGLYEEGRQIGFARVVTDRATYAWLCDVYVLAEKRGQGAGSFLMQAVMDHPDLQGLRRFALVTRDAHALYRRFGFTEITYPERHMAIVDQDIYRKAAAKKP